MNMLSFSEVVTLRLWKEAPCVMGILMLKACHCARCCISLQSPLTFVSQSERVVAREGYHYRYSFEWNCWIILGGESIYTGGRACNSSKEMYRGQSMRLLSLPSV